MEILYIGPYRQNDEWGYTSKALVKLIGDMDFHLVTRPVWFTGENKSRHVEDIEKFERNELASCDVLIQHGLPSYLNYNGDFNYNIAITKVESVMENSEWNTHLRMFDKVIVFSEFEKQLLEMGGLENVSAFHNPPLFVNTVKQELPINIPEEVTTFLTLGTSDRRTGLKEVITAYMSNFRLGEPAILIVSTHDEANVQNMIANVRSELGIYQDPRYYPHIMLVNDDSTPVLNQLFEFSDYFIDASYNSTWNQHLMRAICSGCQPIVSSELLLDHNYSYSYEVIEDICLYDKRPLKEMYSGSNEWLKPVTGSVGFAMTRAFTDSNQKIEFKDEQRQQFLFNLRNTIINSPKQFLEESLNVFV